MQNLPFFPKLKNKVSRISKTTQQTCKSTLPLQSNPNSLNLCKTLRKSLFRHAKGKSMVNIDIANALGQNLANSESCPILRLL